MTFEQEVYMSTDAVASTRLLSLDLHCHLREAVNYAHPSLSLVRQVLAIFEERGLDGIAITDHYSDDFARELRDFGGSAWDGRTLLLGQEVHYGEDHLVEVFLKPGLTFRFIAHPLRSIARRPPEYFRGIHGIEIENGMWNIEQEMVREVAARHNLLLLRNSDAHFMSDVGRPHNRITLEELETAAQGRSST